MSMTLDELRQHKKALEEDLLVRLAEFRVKTGVQVIGVEVETMRLKNALGQTQTYTGRVATRLDTGLE